MASITQTSEGTWRVHIRKRGYASVSKTFKRKSEAQRWISLTEANMVTGDHIEVTKSERARTVGELFDEYLQFMPTNLKNPVQQRIKVNALRNSSDFMNRRLDQICAADIQDWRDGRAKKVEKNTVNREMNTIRSVFSYAMKEWRVALKNNPAGDVARFKNADVKREKRWEQNEIDALLKAAQFDPTSKPKNKKGYAGWAITICIETAMRKGELLKLRAKDFNPLEHYVHVIDPKNGEDRKVPLSKKAMNLIQVLVKDLQPNQMIFPISSSWLGQAFDQYKKAAQIDSDLRIHDGRHEAATRLSEKLSNVLELSAVTGHKSLQSLKRYYNPKPADLAAKLG